MRGERVTERCRLQDGGRALFRSGCLAGVAEAGRLAPTTEQTILSTELAQLVSDDVRADVLDD
jgi:hypothetical protein